VYDLRRRKLYLYHLTNHEEVVEFDLAEELAKKPQSHRMNRLFQQSPQLSEVRGAEHRTDFGTRIELDRQTLEKFAGKYSPEVAPDQSVRIDVSGSELVVQNPDQTNSVLFPETECIFRIAPDRGMVTFQRKGSGAVTGLILHKGKDGHAAKIDAN